MRSRNIKPDFFKSEGLASCKIHSRLLFIGLWCMADREGRLEDRPLRIKAELFPYDNCDVEAMLKELASKTDCDGTPSFILRYGDKKKYIQIVNFCKHQTPHIKEQASTIPAPDMYDANTGQAHLIPDSLLLNPDNGILIDDTTVSGAAKTPLEITFENFKEMRKKIRSPLTAEAERLIWLKLNKLAPTDDEKIEILNQSIMNCWKGIFEVKNRFSGETRPRAPAKQHSVESQLQQMMSEALAREAAASEALAREAAASEG